MLKKSIKKKP